MPVWYAWDGHTVNIWTHHDRAWVRNLRRDQRVAFTARQATPPYGAVTMRGRAETSTVGDDIDSDIRGITRRYIAEDERDVYVAAWSQLRTIVRIHPVTIHAWSRGY